MPDISEQTERRMAEGLRRGEEKSMRSFYGTYGGILAAVCSRYIPDDNDVLDILQDALVKIFLNASSFSYRGKGSLSAWASKVVANQALMFLRQKKKLLVETQDILPDVADDSDPDPAGIPQETLMEMIRSLPDGYRTVFNLYVFGDLSHKEIGDKLGIGADSSASQLLRAKRLLKKKIVDYRQKYGDGKLER